MLHFSSEIKNVLVLGFISISFFFQQMKQCLHVNDLCWLNV